ncbi:MAG TPA: zinc dependent phospholipase C family protein [Bacteroidia bacterium]|nr:zinc dependent phospholipase C family protein [Bacteroidia bacterium]
MKKVLFFSFVFIFLILPDGNIFSWGFWAHKKINHMAVFTLPPGMIGFYKTNIDYITDHATDPDMRRNVMKEEAPRHYFDTDHYGEHTFDSVPKFWKDAVAKYTEDSLEAYGIVPWHIVKMTYALQNAFEEKDVYKILKCSADLGHYVADAHVPLHTTENYNGQLTDQIGIHGFWESRIPELYGDRYDYFSGKANYIDKIQIYSWKIIEESFSAVDSVLRFEKKLSADFPPDKKYSFEQRGNSIQKVFSKEYTGKYHEMLSGMVERRMQQAVQRVGSFWFTAWVNAGSPDLYHIELKKLTKSEKDSIKAQEALWRTGRLKNKGHED